MIVTIKVSVSERDIENGVVGDCDRCPIHLALDRVLSKHYPFKVSVEKVFFYDDDERLNLLDKVNLPLAARKFVSSFDHFQSIVPFEFLLDIDSCFVPSVYGNENIVA